MEGKQTTNIEVKKKNRNRVFRYICKHGTVSNPDISYDMKMSLPTVTQITKELIEKGFIEETGELQSTGGRRAKALSVAVNVKQAVGLDITKNHIGFVLTNLTGEILKYVRIFLPYAHEDAYYRRVNDELESFLEESNIDRKRILGIGISFPGIIDLDRRLITYSHILGVKMISFDSISGFFGYPCCFLNDANAGAYAEGIHSDERERFFYLSLSNTVGGAIFDHNGLVQGSHFRCGEVGHMTVIPDGKNCYCGKKGCLDAYCSAAILSGTTEGKLEKFFGLLEKKDQKAVEMWDVYTGYLAVALNNIHMLLDCDIILGGYVGSYAEPYLSDIWNKVSERNTFTEDQQFVTSSRYKVGAAALGAAVEVIEDFVRLI
ncbi:ROK family transcriptional regulator [Dorea acetigenes]|uniref:ROK family transcriptional regulator n=1 Tax=Dorea acetigenes TaxID=2981787 RepID=A0ABT2RQY1_9FIRM|nr:ROK family transcriptional regulator [Dorea acetigenes]MCB6413513.1 ROK family transcriptional regulator [Faecalimonas umbilicata]MCU6687766.1 ROK family transcriptional regulator [Dorea acetigenes]SCJ55099.1 Making large colonies protein [uncultured Clostridium sp.]